MALETFEIASGIFSLIFVVISLLVGITISLKYFKRKNINFLYVGISWVIICEPWIAISLSFLLHIFTGKGLTAQLHIFIGYFFLSFGIVIWVKLVSSFLYKDKQMIITIIFAMIEAIFAVFFLIFLFTNMSMLGELSGALDVKYGPFLLFIVMADLMIFVMSGILFGQESLKSENLEIRQKGKLILAAFCTYLISSGIGVWSNYSVIILIISRILSILSSILWYFGFLGKILENKEEFVEKKDDLQDFLKVIAKQKHRKFTEEEITFYREQKICLVCKGKTSRLTYICPKCDAIYCVTCSSALSNMENFCWVCGMPFDPSKPVIFPDKKEILKPLKPEKKKIRKKEKDLEL